MPKALRTSFRHSIATRLTLAVLGGFLAITLVLTGLQMIGAYDNTRRDLMAELRTVAEAVRPGLATAIFSVDEEQVNAILSGVIAGASIHTVLVERQFQTPILLGAAPEPETHELSVAVPLDYRDFDGSLVTVGHLTIQSSPDIIFNRVTHLFFIILVNTAVQAAVFCAFVMWIMRRTVARPLNELTEATTRVSLESLQTLQVNMRTKGHDELRVLQDAFNAMLQRLEEHRTAREQAEQQYRSIFQNAQEGIFQSTPAGRLKACNPAMARLLGYDSPEEMQRVMDLRQDMYVDPGERERLLALLRQGAPVTGHEVRAWRRDRSIIWVSINARPIFDTEGRLSLIEGMIEDVTRRKEAEAALQLAKDTAEAASRMKSDFLSMVSHELRTPLTSVLGFAKVIDKRLRKTLLPHLDLASPAVHKAARQVEDNLSVIIAEGERLSDLINDILDLTRLESGKSSWKWEPLDLAEVVEHTLTTVRILAEEKGLALVGEVEPDLPLVLADRDRMIQVLVNLLGNAVKFTAQGRVVCRATRDKELVVVSVTDTGPGIRPEDHTEIFNKFRQLGDTLTDKPSGSGLGLAICKEIVEHHGGRIQVDSTPGRGSTFTFSIPIMTPQSAPQSTPQSTQTP